MRRSSLNARSGRRLGILLALLPLLAGCSLFGSGKSSGTGESVFDVKPGQCFTAPGNVKTELSKVTKVACTKPHTQEAYAVVKYAPTATTASSSTDIYPGADVLTNFAQGTCAQQFQTYVGVNYLDSSLFFTFLLPSARGWETSNDRNVICFVTTTGATLSASVKNTKK